MCQRCECVNPKWEQRAVRLCQDSMLDRGSIMDTRMLTERTAVIAYFSGLSIECQVPLITVLEVEAGAKIQVKDMKGAIASLERILSIRKACG